MQRCLRLVVAASSRSRAGTLRLVARACLHCDVYGTRPHALGPLPKRCWPAQTAQGGASIAQLLGLRHEGLLPALAVPLALTACLFAGPLLLLAWPARPSYARETLFSLPRLQAAPRSAPVCCTRSCRATAH